MTKHAEIVRDQFTKQAISFTQLKGHFDSVQLLIDLTKTTKDDLVLDVACGPGIVACAFAEVASHVTGIDITEKMIEEATKLRDARSLTNVSFSIGEVSSLPFEDDRFSVVISRYTFHHFVDAGKVLQEMVRVCKPGGRVLVADPVLPADKVDAYNRMEVVRDPSYTQALSVEEFDALFTRSGLTDLQRSAYGVDMELEQQLEASFPEEGGKDILRALFEEDLKTNALGTNTRRVENQIIFTYPISVYVGTK